MTKYTLILAPLEVFSKRTFLGQGPETAALPDPEQMENKIKASSVKRQASSGERQRAASNKLRHFVQFKKNLNCDDLENLFNNN